MKDRAMHNLEGGHTNYYKQEQCIEIIRENFLEEVTHELAIKGWIQESQEKKWEKHNTSKVNSKCKCMWMRRNWVVNADEVGGEGIPGHEMHRVHIPFLNLIER